MTDFARWSLRHPKIRVVDGIDGRSGFLGYQPVCSSAGVHTVQTEIGPERFAAGYIGEDRDLSLSFEFKQLNIGVQIGPAQAIGLLPNKTVVLLDGLDESGCFCGRYQPRIVCAVERDGLALRGGGQQRSESIGERHQSHCVRGRTVSATSNVGGKAPACLAWA